jgi:hypothetical protein
MVEADAQWGLSMTTQQDRHGHDTTRWTGIRGRGRGRGRGKGKGKDDGNDDDDSNDSNDSRAGQGGGFVGRRARGRGFLSFKGAGRRGQAQAGAGAFHRPERALALQTTVQPSIVEAGPASPARRAKCSASASASTEARPVLGLIRRLVDSPSTPRHAFPQVLSPYPLP